LLLLGEVLQTGGGPHFACHNKPLTNMIARYCDSGNPLSCR